MAESLSHNDQEALKLGLEIIAMMSQLTRKVKLNETGYVRRTITFPGGSLEMLLSNDPALFDLFEASVEKNYEVATFSPEPPV